MFKGKKQWQEKGGEECHCHKFIASTVRWKLIRNL